MICRLCLTETKFCFSLKNVETQTKDEETEDIAAIIRKHIDLPLAINSNFVCYVCWQKISDFHTYYLFIEEKQKEYSQEIISNRNDATPIATGYDQGMFLEDEVAVKDENDIDIGNECLIDQYIPMGESNGYDQEMVLEDEVAVKDENDIDIGNECLIDQCIPMGESNGYDQEMVLEDEVDDKDWYGIDIRNEFIDGSEHLEETTNFIEHNDIEPASCDTNTNDIAEATRTQQTKITPKKEEKKVLNKIRREKSKSIIAKHAGILKCELCPQTMETFGNLKKHFKKEHGRNGYITCCFKRYFEHYTYAEHLEWHANSNLWKCEPCNLVYSRRDSYDSHLLQVHRIVCTMCSATFVNQDLLHRHEEKFHSKCDECDSKFANADILKCHKSQIHQVAETLNLNVELKIKCNECGKKFKKTRNLKEHIKTVHLRAYTAQCDICGKIISQRHLLNDHKSLVHGMEELAKFQCPHCPKKFAHKFRLNAHIKDGHSEKTPKCDECGKEFKTLNSLIKHERGVHLRAYEFVCDICGKTFASSANFNIHRAKAHAEEANGQI